jgi:hypothetical protein
VSGLRTPAAGGGARAPVLDKIALPSTCQNRFIHLCQLLTLYFVVTFRVLLRVVVIIYDVFFSGDLGFKIGNF